MPTRKRLEEKKNGLLKASKSCFKVNELFKRQTETAIKIVSIGMLNRFKNDEPV